MTIKALKDTEYAPYYDKYIQKLDTHTELLEGFKSGEDTTICFFEAIPETKLTYRYAPEKWTIKDIFQHLTDTERVFMYRCFRISRKDDTPLSGFDQDSYIVPAGATQKSMSDLIYEFKTVRQGTIALLGSLSDTHLAYIGNANGTPLSGRAAAFTILGHNIWHMNIIRERYL